MNLSIMHQKIARISQDPGVYIFRSKNGTILYIGKATNLRSRVQSYFRESGGTDRPIETMIHEVADIKTIQTDSVLEALILEANLIKKHQPKYNAMGKDDKSFSYFVVTRETFPRVMILRETEIEKVQSSKFKVQSYNSKLKVGKTFGPYISKKQMEVALKIIRKIFPFHSSSQKTEKGCLDFQLGRCPGPYASAITHKDYLKNIHGIKMILEGKKKNLVKKMEREMKEFSKKHEYEKAAELRNKIFALKHIQDVALISSDMKHETYNMKQDLRVEAYDISNIGGKYAVGSMVVFSGAEPDKSQYRKFKIKTIEGADDVGMMQEVLSRRFKNDWPASTRGDASSTRGWPQPDLIFLDGGKGHLNMGEGLLKELGLVIPIVAVAKGPTRKISNFQFLISKQIPRLPRPGTGGQAISKILKEILNVIQNKNLVKQIMDEAHRFAVGYHRKLRKNSLLA